MKRSWRILVGVVGLLLVGGCAGRPPAQRTLYDRMGGTPTMRVFVDDLVSRIGDDTRINRFFKNSEIPLPLVKERLFHQFCEIAGGPCTYLGADMKNAHSGMGIANTDFDAVMEDIGASLDKAKVPIAERGEFLALLRAMRKDVVEKP